MHKLPHLTLPAAQAAGRDSGQERMVGGCKRWALYMATGRWRCQPASLKCRCDDCMLTACATISCAHGGRGALEADICVGLAALGGRVDAQAATLDLARGTTCVAGSRGSASGPHRRLRVCSEAFNWGWIR